MRQSTTALLFAASLAACTPGTPVTSSTPAPEKSTSTTASASASPTAKASAAVTTTASATPSAPTGPAVPNTGTFAYAAGQQPHYVKTEPTFDYVQKKTVPTQTHFYLKFSSATDFEIWEGRQSSTTDFYQAGTGHMALYPDWYANALDQNLAMKDVRATAQDQGEETITVPAGTFVCRKTSYDKNLPGTPPIIPPSEVHTILWENGTVGLVKAHLGGKITVNGGTTTADTTFELEQKP